LKPDWGLDQLVEGEQEQVVDPELGLGLGMTLDWGLGVVMGM